VIPQKVSITRKLRQRDSLVERLLTAPAVGIVQWLTMPGGRGKRVARDSHTSCRRGDREPMTTPKRSHLQWPKKLRSL